MAACGGAARRHRPPEATRTFATAALDQLARTRYGVWGIPSRKAAGMSSSEVQGALGVLAAALPGVLVALLSHDLSMRRSAAATRVRLANARALLTVEFDANRQALQTFWQTINALDTAPQ